MEENERYRIVKCRRCFSVFDVRDCKLVEKELYNMKIKEKRCPICEGNFTYINTKIKEIDREHWELYQLPEDVIEKYLYMNREN